METFERKETKYLLSPAQYTQFMARAGAHLVPAEYPEGDIESIYYDTPDFAMINRSLARPKYKEKLRVRSYGAYRADSLVYVEVKKKLKGIVYKRRLACSLTAAQAFLAGMDYEEAVSRWPLAEADAHRDSLCWKSQQVAGELAWMRDHYEGLAPKMLVSVHRVSLVGADDPDLRITFDEDARWALIGEDAAAAEGEAAPVPVPASTAGSAPDAHAMFENGERILEVKCTGAIPLWLVQVLGECEIRPQSVSKYGRAYQAAAALQLPAVQPRIAACAPAAQPAAAAALQPATRSAAALRPSSRSAAVVPQPAFRPAAAAASAPSVRPAIAAAASRASARPSVVTSASKASARPAVAAAAQATVPRRSIFAKAPWHGFSRHARHARHAVA